MEDNELEKPSVIDAAIKAAQRIEEANKVSKEILERNEFLFQRRILGGHAEAGNKEPEMTKEEKSKQDMKNYFKGTAIEKALQ